MNDGSTFSNGTMVFLKQVCEPDELPHGHLVLEGLGHEDYVMSDDDCLFLPAGVMHYDPEFKTFELAEELAADGADEPDPDMNEGVFVCVNHVLDYEPEAMVMYANYKEAVDLAVGFEAEVGEYLNVEGIYPEVMQLLQNLLLDPLAPKDPVGLGAAAQYLIEEGIENPHHRNIAMGLFVEYRAEAAMMYHCEGEVLGPNEARVCFMAGRELSTKEAIDVISEAVAAVLSDDEVEAVDGFVYDHSLAPAATDEDEAVPA